MTVQSGGNDDDPKKDWAEEKQLADDDNDLDATRILPMRAPGTSTPGAVIGTSGEPDDDDLEETRIPPMRAQDMSTPGAIIGTSEEPDADEEGADSIPTSSEREPEPSFNPAVGWLVILEGPGRGQHCPVYYGQNSIGRGEEQRIRLNFGDARITRDTHAFLVYDDLVRKFYLRDNGKATLLRLNNVAVMMPTEVTDRDIISIGDTVMLFVALCGADFDWLESDGGPASGTGA